ncbi:hypothetical protein B0H15DRAFT_807900 [Mycena belliarum]|uniref:Uncharacterized protein n=1 Tax=Mycena belliarum TaxID=1033014 RepID=A0AAD6TQ83_9AGAR|nr:hypothetical protein B0H15DRAFT_807900 [Mycena belliae]
MTQFPYSTPTSTPSPAAVFSAAAQEFTTAAHLLAAAAAGQNLAAPQPATVPSPQPTPASPAGINQDPNRPTCRLPYFPSENAPDRDAYSKSSKTKFYVAGPAKHEGAYTDDKVAAAECSGYANGRMQGCTTWEDAEAHWVKVCRSWHGLVCEKATLKPRVNAQTRISLTPMRSRSGRFWGCKGIRELFETRRAALDAAEAAGLEDISIVSSYSVSDLETFVTSA